MSEFNPGLKQGEMISNTTMMAIFRVGNAGGMRQSNTNKSLVIVSDHTKGIYDDKWLGPVLHYTGFGMRGDQELKGANRTLFQYALGLNKIFLFEVFKKNEYIFQGEVELVENAYQTHQLDIEGKKRKVWIFPIAVKDGSPVYIENEERKKLYYEKLARSLPSISTTTLKALVEKKNKNVLIRTKTTIANKFERDDNVVIYALKRAKGTCQLCEKEGPFKKGKNLYAFLEVHHIDYLSKGGSDTFDNVVGLCPNCHRKVHALENKKDVEIIKQKALTKL